ncbi:hypothetical protein [Coleofasciculus sp. H7-2]|uniref:hypothetical protein n=1 Tax=Coleofasciculus sp. H7-2 TaxID=3351545 RepID=UPI00366BA5FE
MMSYQSIAVLQNKKIIAIAIALGLALMLASTATATTLEVVLENLLPQNSLFVTSF